MAPRRLGLDELFTKGGKLTWQCAVGSLQAFRLATKKEVEEIDSPNNKPTKLHIGSANVIAFVAVLHMIFGALAAHNGNTAVAERMAAETDLPVKRRSSFEPEAAEGVKEDDKEDSNEKKGFSMWESISRSVTPPAPSGTESPIHVKIEE